MLLIKENTLNVNVLRVYVSILKFMIRKLVLYFFSYIKFLQSKNCERNLIILLEDRIIKCIILSNNTTMLIKIKYKYR